MKTHELNMDGLVGPTHHYAGLSVGNKASRSHTMQVANPQAAALQGLHKMRLLHQLGVKQAFIPPQPRPNLALLRQLGFSGTPAQCVRKAKKQAPELLSACYSAASMWTANAATVSPSRDTGDGRVHFTAANLITNLHRHQEAAFTEKLLQWIFSNEQYFHHHPPLPATTLTRDEGAANHNRLCRHHGDLGTHIFVYNQNMLPLGNHSPTPSKYPARQTKEASEAITRSHLLNPKQVVFAHQNPMVVDQGVFHNDVIAVANESVLMVHESAFLNQKAVLAQLDPNFHIIDIKNKQLSVSEAVQSYFFNSQLVTLPNQTMALIAPSECVEHPRIHTLLNELITSPTNPIQHVHYLDLKQSMQNGGGPACLRLRVVLTEEELKAMHQGVLITDERLDQLERWVKTHYRTALHANDLDDPALIQECASAEEALSKCLDPSINMS